MIKRKLPGHLVDCERQFELGAFPNALVVQPPRQRHLIFCLCFAVLTSGPLFPFSSFTSVALSFSSCPVPLSFLPFAFPPLLLGIYFDCRADHPFFLFALSCFRPLLFPPCVFFLLSWLVPILASLHLSLFTKYSCILRRAYSDVHPFQYAFYFLSRSECRGHPRGC